MPVTFLDFTLLLLTSILLYSKFFSYHYTVSIMRRTKSLNRESVEKHKAIMRISSMEAVNVGSNLTEDKKINMKISFKENVFEMLKVQEKFAREVIVYHCQGIAGFINKTVIFTRNAKGVRCKIDKIHEKFKQAHYFVNSQTGAGIREKDGPIPSRQRSLKYITLVGVVKHHRPL